jgi:hypothetical protein
MLARLSRDHWPGRSRAAEHQRHGPGPADAYAGEAAKAVAGDLRVGSQRGGGLGQLAFDRHEGVPGEPGQPGRGQQVAETGRQHQ